MNERAPIPKTVYYCWFGGNELTRLANKCIKSWKKYLPSPEYKIVEINEKNFDINYNKYVKEAYEAKKWAFVSDVARLYFLANFGGIYLDTDQEIIKPIDSILNMGGGILGFEAGSTIGAGFLACNKGNALFNEFLHVYDNASFVDDKEESGINLTINVRLTMFLVRKGLLGNAQRTELYFDDISILPYDIFYPEKTGKIKTTENTVSVHHGAMSYTSKYDRFRNKCFRLSNLLLGEKVSSKLYKVFGRNRT